MMSWRPLRISSLARAVMSVSAWEPAPRSTGIMPPFHMHQPKIGIHISSRLTMKVKSSNSRSSANVSQVD